MSKMDFSHTIKSKFSDIKQFLIYVVEHFIEDDCTYRASALTFTTLLALVPLMSVGFSILSTFPVFEELRQPLQDFIFDNFVPATGKAVQAYLQKFATQVSKLSIVGIIFLFITAILVMFTIERSMNRIWRVGRSRHGVSAFLLYWAILSLAPIFLGLSLAASSYFFSLPFTRGYHAPATILIFAPALLSLSGFTFLYVVVPNCRVKLLHGFYGALVATFLFETAKKGFAFYLSQYNTYELLYGAFATIPIFFIWIYWVWIITLIGAEISYAFSVHYDRRQGTPIDGFSQALIWLHEMWLAQEEGHSISTDDLIHVSHKPYAVDVGDMIATLTQADLVNMGDDGNYFLSRDLNRFSLYDLANILPYPLPHVSDLDKAESTLEQNLQKIIQQTDADLKKHLALPLATIFSMDPATK